MQSGVAANLNRSCRIIARETNRIVNLNRAPAPALRWLCSTAKDGTGGSEAARKPQPQQKSKPEEDDSATHPIKPPKIPHSSPKLESTEINPGPNPILQQKRSRSSSTSSQPEATSAGPPVDVDEDWIQSGSIEAEEDDKEYFSHNKPSPLSEIEVADTRKPITRATDGEGGGGGTYYGGGEWSEKVWMPEQLDTAEEAMERAMKIWTRNKMTGADPDAPHSRVLRALRGE